MKKRSVWFWPVMAGSLGLLVLLSINLIAIFNKPSNEIQIVNAIEQMRKNSIDGKSGGVLEVLSESFEIPAPYSPQLDGSALQLVKTFLRSAKIKKLEIKNVKAEVYGKTAIARGTLDTDLEYIGRSFVYNGPIEINLRKEETKRLFFLPDPRWLVIGFGPLDISQFGSLEF